MAFYKNVDGGDFNGDLVTFPKVFQKTDTRLQSLANGTWVQRQRDLTTRKVLINWGGQGTYFNPQFCQWGIRWWSRQGIRPK